MSQDRQPHHSNCPVVGKGVMPLAEVVRGQSGCMAAFFEREVTWLRETEATVVLRHANGEDLKVGVTHDDHYGLLTSLGEIVPLARAWTERFEATPGSILEVVVILTAEDRPFEDDRIAESPSASFRTRFLGIPRDWFVARDRDVAERWASGGFRERDALLPAMEFIVPRKVLDARVVWSSRNAADPVAELALWDACVGEVLAGVPEDGLASVRESLAEAFAARPEAA